MFTGLVEWTVLVKDLEIQKNSKKMTGKETGKETGKRTRKETGEEESSLSFSVQRPKGRGFSHLRIGESMALDGACLTLEKFDTQSLSFSLGPETLQITQWTAEKLKHKLFNIERSMTLQTAIGGCLLTGHIDGLALVQSLKKKGKSLLLDVEVPPGYEMFFWKKGYIALNGVSLTINRARKNQLQLCIVPQTLKLSNLSEVKVGTQLNFEIDYLARIFIQGLKNHIQDTSYLVGPETS